VEYLGQTADIMKLLREEMSLEPYINRIVCGDCREVMKAFPSERMVIKSIVIKC